MGLRGEAAIVGYVELPPERLNKASPAPFVHRAMGGTLRRRTRRCGAAWRGRQRHRGVPPGRVGDLRPLHDRRIPRRGSTIRRARGSRGRQRRGHGVAGGRGRSNSASATRCCAHCRPATSPRRPSRSPGRWSTRCSSARRATNTALRKPNSRFPTATSARTGPTARWPSVTRRSTATTSGRWPRSSSITRVNANHTDGAIWKDKPLTVEDVLASPVIADPLHMLEIVMPCVGGAAVVVANADIAKRSRNRPVWIKGFGEHVPFKTPTYAEDLLSHPDRGGRRHRVRHDRSEP